MIDYQVSERSNLINNQNNFYDWIDYYHSQLEKNFAKFGLKANYVFLRDQIDADLRRFAKFFLANGVMLSTMLVRGTARAAEIKETMNAIDFDNVTEQMKLSSSDSETIQKFKNELKVIVDSFIDFGYL